MRITDSTTHSALAGSSHDAAALRSFAEYDTAWRKPTVLYVEDNPVNALLMQAMFERRPHLLLRIAGDCGQAVRMAFGLNPVLLLLDIGLPDGDGVTLLRRLRHVQGCRTAPAIAVTADATFELAGTAFTERWLKPIDLQALLQRLDDLVPAVGAPARCGGRG